MPPLKQPKDLSYLCYSTFSIHCAKCLKNFGSENLISEFRDFFSNLPISILENLGSWIVQNAAGLIHCLSGGDQIGKDDQVFLFGTYYLNRLHQCFNVRVWELYKVKSHYNSSDKARHFIHFSQNGVVRRLKNRLKG